MIRALHTRMRASAAAEDGWAMVIAIVLATLMTGVGLATYAYVDGQSRGSARERLNESGFNLAEGALTQQMAILTRQWPGSQARQYPVSCPSTTQPHLCPDSGALTGSYASPDYNQGLSWTTEVHDNGQGDSPDFYNDATPDSDRYDENRDGKVWVRAQATIRGRTRVILGLVQVQEVSEQMPRAALVAGSVITGNSGNKDIICTRLPDDPEGKECTPASSGLAGPVKVRCSQSQGSSCLDVRSGQIDPDPVQYDYAGGNSLTEDAIDRLRQRAVEDGTYWANGCPPNPSGAVVFVENGNCSYNNSVPGPCCNSVNKPGLFIIGNGTVSFTGNHTFYGVIYALNRQGATGCTPACPVELGGGITVRGGVQVDGAGGIKAGSNKLNILFDDYAFASITSYGAASLVQNKWREITPRPGT
jgi:hypothetical protein